jgi:small-conductance mechanosensitive channel
MGDVVEKSLLITRIRTVKNVDITIPNSLVLNSHIINFSTLAKTDGLILNLEVTIGYDAPWRQVHDLLVNAALKTENILASPSPFVYQTSLDDSYVRYELNAYTRNSNAMVAIYSELRQSIQDSFNAAGVEIMSPIYSAIRDGNTIAIPESDRPSDYQAPSFRVSQQQGTETGLGEGVRI